MIDFKPVDCSVLNKSIHGDGVYMIYPTGGLGFEVYCDMKTDGGGWTVDIHYIDIFSYTVDIKSHSVRLWPVIYVLHAKIFLVSHFTDCHTKM